MLRKALTWLASTSWWPFLAPGPRISPQEFRRRLAGWKISKVSVATWSGEWTEEKAKTIELFKRWQVPISHRLSDNVQPPNSDSSSSRKSK